MIIGEQMKIREIKSRANCAAEERVLA